MAGIGTARFQISMSKFPATIFSNILLYIYIYFVLWVLYNWYKFHTFPVCKSQGKGKKLRTFLFALLSFRRFREKCLFIIFYMMEYLTFFFFSFEDGAFYLVFMK